ncbi:MAG: DUF3800 domain-containing protein [Nitrososphaerales archaeon]
MKRFAYTDESGNSGLKLFDSGQETFWTGTLIAYADVDTRYSRFHREFLALVGKQELHGAELGFGGMEAIASRLSSFIREKNLYFVFGRVDKPFLAASKLFDLAFDSGTNPGMPTHAYAVQQLRQLNLMHFVQMLQEGDLREFWDIFTKQDANRFGALLGNILKRVPETPFDQRTKQIFSDVLAWGSAHPDEVLDPFGEGDSPNYVAFSTLFGQLHTLHNETGDTIGSFVHDEQNQFVPMFAKGWDLLSKFEGKNHPMATIADWKKIESFECDLVEKSSADSFGLQVIDVCMWLLRRAHDNRDNPRENCRTLFECLVERSTITRFDFETLVRSVESGARYVDNLPLTEKQLDKGRAMLAEFEEARQMRLLLRTDSSALLSEKALIEEAESHPAGGAKNSSP